MCSEKCPCTDNSLCKFCNYCTFCPACSLCSAACEEDSLIRASLTWFDSWKSRALSVLGVEDIEIPDLEQVDQELEKDNIEQRLRGTRIKLLVSELQKLEVEAVFAIWRLLAGETTWADYTTKDVYELVKPLVEKLNAMSAEEREATWHRLYKRRPELWREAEEHNHECQAAGLASLPVDTSSSNNNNNNNNNDGDSNASQGKHDEL